MLVLNVVATLGALAAAIASWLSVRVSARSVRVTQSAVEGQMYYTLLERYSEPEMASALSTLRDWKEMHGEGFAEKWREALDNRDPGAEKVNQARRHVSHFFQRAWALYDAGYADKRFVEAVGKHFLGTQIFLMIVEPLEQVLNPNYDRKSFNGFREICGEGPYKTLKY